MGYSDSNNTRARVSESFSVAKFLSIMLVVTGHYFEDSYLWVPVSVALFIFSFSSGYFSAERYFGEISFKKFWLSKFKRLIPPLFFVNLFLLLLFLAQGKAGIANFHTIIAWFGLSGVLDWLSIRNASPFGNGLWFFTVLLIFYVLFPLLNKVFLTPVRSLLFVIVFGWICILGQVYASPPYMLWLTAFGFVFGIFASRVNWRPSIFFAWVWLLIFTTFFLAANFLGYKHFNLAFIAMLSIASVAVLISTALPRRYIGPLAIWIPCVFEIYFVHTYLFVSPQYFGVFLGYVVSIVLILLVSYVLANIRKFFFKCVGG